MEAWDLGMENFQSMNTKTMKNRIIVPRTLSTTLKNLIEFTRRESEFHNDLSDKLKRYASDPIIQTKSMLRYALIQWKQTKMAEKN